MRNGENELNQIDEPKYGRKGQRWTTRRRTVRVLIQS